MEHKGHYLGTKEVGLRQHELAHILHVFASYPDIERAILYGSRAKGNFKSYSDVDISLCGALDLTVQHRIEIELDDLNLPYKFDLNIYNNIGNEELRSHIDRVGIMLYKK